MIPSHFQLTFESAADPAAVIQPEPTVRLTILTDRIIRIEVAPDQQFEDRPTQTFWHRKQPIPTFESRTTPNGLEIETDYLLVRFKGLPLSADNLSIRLKETDTRWHYGDEPTGNLKGTYRTLDNVSGEIGLEPGLLSTDGWALIDDSAALIINAEGWVENRNAHPEAVDLYFFGYNQAYETCLQAFSTLSGPTPMIPRWVLGNWWSRYWEYTENSLSQVVETFEHHDIPLSVCIIDMDWHTTETGGYHSGWTGYTWDHDYFPDPARFLAWLDSKGLHKTLNLHPADGIAPHEARYEAMCEALGLDPAQKEPIPFQISNTDFANAYFKLLHHPFEEMGIDFWWMDWQQGVQSELDGLDPLWMLNHLHFLDLGRDGEKRPFIFSRYGGLGHHRYPIGFSGDAFSDWPSLAFQPYFTATAANVGYGWWSHDIGGHQIGIESAELYTRWVQFGVFSPIMRLHSTKNRFHERHPWGYDAETLRIVGAVMRFRHALIPYLYTMVWRNAQTQLPMIQPMYHRWPEEAEAYRAKQQYTFGSELIVAPYTAPMDPDVGLSRQVVWFPPGDWFDFFTGEHFEGGRWHAIYGTMEHIPVFAKAGAIIPLEATAGWGSGIDAGELDVHFFAGSNHRFELYEDDGETVAYKQGHFATTQIRQEWSETNMILRIDAAKGQIELLPDERDIVLVVHGIIPLAEVEVTINGRPIKPDVAYAADDERLEISNIVLTPNDNLQVVLYTDEPSLLSKRPRREDNLFGMIEHFSLDTLAKRDLADEHYLLAEEPERLIKYAAVLKPAQMRALLELVFDAGIHEINFGGKQSSLLAWNNSGREDITLNHAVYDQSAWNDGRFSGSHQICPAAWGAEQAHEGLHQGKFLHPIDWQLSLTYAGLHTTVLSSQD